jgi:hypothetical protein
MLDAATMAISRRRMLAVGTLAGGLAQTASADARGALRQPARADACILVFLTASQPLTWDMKPECRLKSAAS